MSEKPDAQPPPPDAAHPADAAPQPDAEVIAMPSTQFQTAGGGAASSANFQARIRIGAPQPMGAASSPNFSIRLGPTTE